MKVFNSLSQKLEEFNPQNPKKVTIYVCGITPYDTTHLGHAFTYISFDVLIRYLKFKGFEVIYTQNVTDINDRDKDILERARQQNIPWKNLAKYWTDRFLKDMDKLNWIFPTHYLNASDQIPAVVNLIQKLLNRNLAYQVNESIYLEISKIPGFGKLSGLRKEEMLKIARDFEEDLDNPDKKNPLDITLWRSSTPDQPAHIPSFPSPFGKGRPGWHIECSAMSTSTLGDQIDIHCGGADLVFPHHEAEIAQSEGATGKIPFARYWLHNGTVAYQGEKMSKSKGNLVRVDNLLKQYSPNAIRWLLLSHHWQQKWEFKQEDLQQAQLNSEKINKYISKAIEKAHGKQPAVNTIKPDVINQFKAIMGNNLDTPKALGFLQALKDPYALCYFYQTLGFIV